LGKTPSIQLNYGKRGVYPRGEKDSNGATNEGHKEREEKTSNPPRFNPYWRA